MNPFRAKLLDRLRAADDRKASLSRALGDAQLWLTGAFGVSAAAVGLGIAEVADWSDPGIVAGVGGMAGILFGLVQRREHTSLTDEQKRSRADIRQWVYVSLLVRTGAGDDEHPLLMLQQAIEDESARSHSHSVLERVVVGKRKTAIRANAKELHERLRWNLIPAADVAGDGHIVAALRSLDAALDGESSERGDTAHVLACLHTLMVATELAPAFVDTAADDQVSAVVPPLEPDLDATPIGRPSPTEPAA
jgi:hypothetical protein